MLIKKINTQSSFFFVSCHVILLSLMLSLLLSNLASLYYSCINANDFSIYQQAIYKLSNFQSLNPFTSIRDLKIFSDHFDPIIILPAILIKLTHANPFLIFIFEWSLWALFAFLVYRLGDYKWKSFDWIKALTVIVFSKSLLSGLDFPIHPTTWSMIPLLFLSYFIKQKNHQGIFYSALSLLLFKELFVFMIVGLAGYYLLARQFKLFLSLFILGLLSYWFIFIKRPELFGSQINYGNSLLSALLKNPIKTLYESWLNFSFPWIMFIPSLFLIPRNKWFEALPLFFFVLPGILIHILGARIVHHHSIALVTIFLSFGLLHKSPHWLLVFVFFATGIGRHTRSFKNLFTTNFKTCQHKNDKIESIKKAQAIIQPLDEKTIVLSSNGIIPRILSPSNTIFQMDTFTLPRNSYDYLVIEKNNFGDIYPTSQSELDALRLRCLPYASKVWMDNEHLTIMQGPFNQSCVQLKSFIKYDNLFRLNLIEAKK